MLRFVFSIAFAAAMPVPGSCRLSATRVTPGWKRTDRGDSIYGTTYGPVQNVQGLRTTADLKSVYVHLFDGTPPLCAVPGISRRVLSARLLANGMLLKFRQTEAKVEIEIPFSAPDPDDSVIALKLF